MNFKRIFTKSVSLIMFVILFGTASLSMSKAVETTCPEGYSDEQCLQFLQDQRKQIDDAKNQAGSEISKEEYAQKDLNEKIDYLNGQINAATAKINAMEIDIETNNVEIRIIGKNISTIQENISTLTQETDQLRDTINKRVSLSYKYDKMSPLEVMFSADNFDTMLRKTKYLLEARKRDRDELEQLGYNMATLKAEEVDLGTKKADIQKKRNEIEVQKSDIFMQKQALLPQQADLSNLIAQSKAREDAYRAKLSELASTQNNLDNQIQSKIMEMFHKGQLPNGGHVNKGQIIGFQGHTGCAMGSHLHFGMTQGGNQWYANVDPFVSEFLYGGAWYGAYLSPRNASVPEDGALITQGFHQGMNLDMISTAAGDQSGNGYIIPDGDLAAKCHGMYDYSGWASLTGEGAPVYAVLSGTVYYGTENWGGANYALVDHGDNLVSIYMHLRGQ